MFKFEVLCCIEEIPCFKKKHGDMYVNANH